MNTSNLVRVLDILERDVLLEHRADETDGPVKLIYLTADGNLRVNETLHKLNQADELILSVIFNEEIAVMVTSFEKINRRMSEICTDNH